jgi:hypothetical protein
MSNYAEIVELVEKEAVAIENLLKTMIKKQEFIISMTVDNLHNTINEEIKLVSLTKTLENERLSLMKDILPDIKDAGKVTMSEIIKYAPEKESKNLQKLKERLKNSLNEMKHVNDLNMVLLDRSKKFIKENISILTCHGEKQIVNRKV